MLKSEIEKTLALKKNNPSKPHKPKLIFKTHNL